MIHISYEVKKPVQVPSSSPITAISQFFAPNENPSLGPKPKPKP